MNYKQWLEELAVLYREALDKTIQDSAGWKAAFDDGYKPIEVIELMVADNG